MPLKIKLTPKDRILINGAVIENASDTTILIIHNHVDILRRKEIMQENEATSPARRIYYAIQCAYLFPEDRTRYLQALEDLLQQYLRAAASATPVLEQIAKLLDQEKYYEALKITRKLIEHEAIRITAARHEQTSSKPDRSDPTAVKPVKKIDKSANSLAPATPAQVNAGKPAG